MIINYHLSNRILGWVCYEVLWWQKKTDTGKSYCSITANDKLGTFYSNVGTSTLVQPHGKNYSLGFDLGYFN